MLRIRNPVSDAFLIPGSGMGNNQDPRSGYGMNNPDNISESLEAIFWGLKYSNSLMRIRDPWWKIFVSEIRNEKIRIRDPGSATLVLTLGGDSGVREAIQRSGRREEGIRVHQRHPPLIQGSNSEQPEYGFLVPSVVEPYLFFTVPAPVPVPVPTFEKLRFRFRLLKKLWFRFRFLL